MNTENTISTDIQHIQYTSFKQPRWIKESGYEQSFWYGSDKQRRKSVLELNQQQIKERIYLGSYECVKMGSETHHLHYVSAGGKLIAIVNQNRSGDEYYYTYTNHLGSIVAFTDEYGTVVAEQNFDAWGNARNPDTWTYDNIPGMPEWINRGYTGHEHMPHFALINMNGRMYDPLLSRMGVSGAALGGVVGGLDAANKDVNFFTGKADLDLSTGFGAHAIENTNQTVTVKYVGKFEGVNMYETPDLGSVYGSGGITLPGRGIVVGKGVFSQNLDPFLVRHEFGHILQAREFGIYRFYTRIGPSSLLSAARHDGINHFHNTHWTEILANQMSYKYFGNPTNWPIHRFPLVFNDMNWFYYFIF